MATETSLGAIAISNTALQSGNGAFVMCCSPTAWPPIGLVGQLGPGMPLVAIVWRPLWRRMRIITTAELITLRYGGAPARLARKVYAVVCCFGFSVLLIAYITGFFAKTIAPNVQLSELQILAIFGERQPLHHLRGTYGVVVTEVLHFVILLAGSTVFMFTAVAQMAAGHSVGTRCRHTPEALNQIPPVLSAAPITRSLC